MIKVLNISGDRAIFRAGSPARRRMEEYANLFEELHIIVYARSDLGLSPQHPTAKLWLYPTNSRSRFFYPLRAWMLGRQIIKERMTPRAAWVVTAQDPFEIGLAGWLIARATRLPLQIQIHTDFLSPFFSKGPRLNRFRARLAKFLLPRASGIRVVSRRIADSLARFRLAGGPVTVLPISTVLVSGESATPGVSIKDMCPDFAPILLSVARLAPEKNLALAVRVLKEVAEKYPRAGLVVIGDGPEKNNLLAFIRKNKMTERVRFLPWRDDLGSCYKSADLFLQTSLYEGYGLALVEAVAAGLPAVSSDVGVAGELLSGAPAPLVCPPGDTRCFISLVNQAIETPALAHWFHTNGRELVSRVSCEKNAYLKVYREALESLV